MRPSIKPFVIVLGIIAATCFSQPATPATNVQNSATVKTFPSGIPLGYQLVREGALSEKEGKGSFLVIKQPGKSITGVIIDIEKLGWFRATKLKRANPVVVGQDILTRFFPGNKTVRVSQNKKYNRTKPFASHLVLTNKHGTSKPAIALRLLYPDGRAIVILLKQSSQSTPANPQGLEASYQLLEYHAREIVAQIPAAETSLLSERFILWRLHHIYGNSVFNHQVK